MMKSHATITRADLDTLEDQAKEIKRCAERLRAIAASCRTVASRTFDQHDETTVDAHVAGIQNALKRIGDRLGIATGML